MSDSIQVKFSRAEVFFYEPFFDQFKNSPRGEIGDHIEQRAGRAILLAAKRQVGVRTGMLKETIRMTHVRVGLTQELRIGSDYHIALLHHEGTRPHSITPNGPHMLRFTSKGRVVYSRHVNHPGTRPNRYLSDNLYLAYV